MVPTRKDFTLTQDDLTPNHPWQVGQPVVMYAGIHREDQLCKVVAVSPTGLVTVTSHSAPSKVRFTVQGREIGAMHWRARHIRLASPADIYRLTEEHRRRLAVAKWLSVADTVLGLPTEQLEAMMVLVRDALPATTVVTTTPAST